VRTSLGWINQEQQSAYVSYHLFHVPLEFRATVPMSFDNPALRPLAEADESTSRAVRELLRLKAQVTEVTPTQHGMLWDLL